MNTAAAGDAGRDARNAGARENRERSNSTKTSGAPVDYVRDGALAAHKRGLSGNLLTKLGFTKGGAGASTSPEPQKNTPYAPLVGNPEVLATNLAHDGESAARAAMAASGLKKSNTLQVPAGALATRSRKGSLRKNILRKGSLQRMETILSPRMESRMSNSTDSTEESLVMSPTSPEGGDLDDDYPTPRASYDRDSVIAAGRATNAMNRGGVTRDGLHIDGGLQSDILGGSVSRSRNSSMRDNSTTDEDEKPPGSSSSNTSSGLMMVAPKRPSVVADSYFPPQQDTLPPASRRRPSPMKTTRTTKSSPLSALPLDAASPGPLSPDAWDYAETEWWGWIILVVTWITFVVGMGSCFGTWSWAWDVGETPYAPPELEDDPTLPIVGYYPALIVLTGVMAWVWVIIAWVGMKYFKHAKMSGEDG